MKAKDVPRTLDERLNVKGTRRRLRLNRHEKEALTQHQLVEGAVSLYLNLEDSLTRQQMADELGVTIRQFKDITHSDEFKIAYEKHFEELGHDPRLKATKAGLVDLLPTAFRQLKSLLETNTTPPTVLMKAIDKVFELNGIRPSTPQVSDRKQLAEFLGKHNLNLTQFNIYPPSEYPQALEDVVEGVVVGEEEYPQAEE